MEIKNMSVNFDLEEDRHLARVITTIILVSAGGYLLAVILGLFSNDRLSITVTLVGCALFSIPLLLVRSRHLRLSGLLVMLIELAILTAIATAGQGIHDQTILIFPIIMIFAGLALERSIFRLCVLLVLGAVCWLFFGEYFGLFIAKPFLGGAVVWFIGTMVILLVTAFSVDLLAFNMRRGLNRARAEVAERKLIEERLEQEKILLRTLIDNLPDRIYVKDVKGNKILSNTADWQASGGKKMEDVIGKTDMEIYPPELAKTYSEIDHKVIDSGMPVDNYEEEGLDLQGKPVWVLTSKVPLRNAQGNVVGLVGSGHDITLRKQVEHALAWERYLLGTLLDNLPDHIYFKDRNGCFTRISRSQAKAFGLSDPAEALGKTDFDFFTEMHAHPALEAEKKIMATGQPMVGLEEKETWLDGRLTWVYTTKMPLQDKAGNIIGTFGISSDITERKRVEQALRQSEAQLRAVFASMHDVVLVIDHNGVYREIAPTIPELLVRQPEELLGKNLRDVFPPEQAETFIHTVRQVLDTKKTAQIEYDLIIGYRTVRFETSISPMTEDSTLWVAHDITRRKRLEQVQNAIQRISQAAITSEGIETLYGSIHSVLRELIPTENFYIATYDSVNELISFPYFVDQYDEKPLGPTKLQGLTGYVIRTGRSLLATRQVFDQLVKQGEIEPVGTTGENWMGAPLKVEGRTIGVIAMQSYAGGFRFSREDLNLLEVISIQVAQVIERKRMEDEIRSLSLTDEPTGLYNRRGFTLLAEENAKLAVRMKRNMLLFFCDLDKLKKINDTFGHVQGDRALKDISTVLKETFRETDIQARYGGDEFVVLAVDSSMESGEVLVNRIHANLEKRNLQKDRPYQLFLSIGIARFDPETPSTVSEMIAQADGLMYQQKQEKKKRK